MFTPVILNSIVPAKNMEVIIETMSNSVEEEVGEEDFFIITKKHFYIAENTQAIEFRQCFLHHVHLHDDYIYNAVYAPPNYL